MKTSERIKPTRLKRRAAMFGIAGAAALLLSGCEDFVRIWHTPRGDPDVTFRKMSEEGQGFTVGSAAAPQTVYILFDPQCSHCGSLWRNSQPLLASGKVKFVWMPVAAMRKQSAPQGATILAAADPAKKMTEHEDLLLSNKGGLEVSSAPDDKLAIVLQNTKLANALRIDQVPYLSTKRTTGTVVLGSGEMTPEALEAFLGLRDEPNQAASAASR